MKQYTKYVKCSDESYGLHMNDLDLEKLDSLIDKAKDFAKKLGEKYPDDRSDMIKVRKALQAVKELYW